MEYILFFYWRKTMLLSFLAVIIKAFDNYVVWMTSEINIVLNHRQNFTKEIRISIHPFIVWLTLVRLCRVQFELKFEKKKSIAENFGHFRGKKLNNLAFKRNEKEDTMELVFACAKYEFAMHVMIFAKRPLAVAILLWHISLKQSI